MSQLFGAVRPLVARGQNFDGQVKTGVHFANHAPSRRVVRNIACGVVARHVPPSARAGPWSVSACV